MQFADVANDSALDHVAAHKSGLVREFIGLWVLARYRLSRGARPWLGVTTALATALVAIFLHFHVLRPVLWRSGDVYAALPLTTELARLPMSMLLPTAYLPLWAACAQLVVVIGLGEMILGRWLTVAVAVVGHVASTLIARLLLESAHGHVFGMVPAMAHALDTGPSAATAAVGACLLVATRMNRCALLLTVGIVTAALITRGVDGVEHTTAILIGGVAGVADCVVIARLSRLRDASSERQWSARLTRVLQVPKSIRRALAVRLMRTDAR
jgi:hypothetical protein